MSRNCFGIDCRLLGQKRDPMPPAMMTQYLLLAISYNMELSETKIKIFCNFAAYCRNNIFVLPMKIRLFTIPNLLTLAGLLCGSFAVVSALVYGDLALAFWLTIAAGVFDYSDGFVARLLKCPSAIGVQLDSLSDMVSFGFARRPCFSSCGTIPCLRMPKHGCATAAVHFVSRWRPSRRCGWRNSISTRRSIPSSAAFLLQPMRCFSYLWGGLR